MAPDRRGGRLTPEQIARASFQTSFRGYDPDHVRQLLVEVAEELREHRDREAALRTEIEALEIRATRATEPLDEDALTAALGEETAHVLTAAREAAAQIRSKGEESVARMLREAQDEAARLRTEAEGVLAERTTAAEAAAAELRAKAEDEMAAAKVAAAAEAQSTRAAAEQVLTDARTAAERTHTTATETAAAEVEKARADGRTMVQEAQAVRERVLKDLARKRRTARAQLEQLRAGRERLLEAYELVRRTLGEATGELSVSLTEAKLAADAAVRRVEDEPEPTVEELEAEVEAARLAGLTVVDRAGEPAFDPDVEPLVVEAGLTTPAAARTDTTGGEPGGTPAAGASTADGERGVGASATEGGAGGDADAAAGGAERGDATGGAGTTAEGAKSQATSDAASNGAAGQAPSGGPAVVDELPPLPDEIPPPMPTLDPIRPPRKGRRKRGVPELPPTELQPMSPRDPVEGMRVITGETPVVRPGAAPDATGAAEAGADDVPADAVAAAGAGTEAEPSAAGAEDGVTDAAVARSDDEITEETEAVDVDDLFARMRAARVAEPDAGGDTADASHAAADADETKDDHAGTDSKAEAAEQASTADDEAILERRDGLVDAIDRAATRKLKRVLADEQSEVLDLLRRTRGVTIEKLYADGLEAQVARWSAAAAPDLEEAALAGAGFYRADGPTPRPTDDLATALATELVQPLRDRVEAALRAADGDEETAADGIRAAYREWKSKRVADQTRDAIVAAFSRGLFDAAPDGEQSRWLVDDGGVPCPDCDDDALAGGVAKGEPFPTGHCHPPAHPGCRCLLVPM